MAAVTESIKGDGQRLCMHPLQEPNILDLIGLRAPLLLIPTKISLITPFVSYSSSRTPW